MKLNNKKIKVIYIIAFIVIANLGLLKLPDIKPKEQYTIIYDINGSHEDVFEVLYTYEDEFTGEYVEKNNYKKPHNVEKLEYLIPKDISKIRFDFGTNEGNINVSNIKIKYYWKSIDITNDIKNKYEHLNQMSIDENEKKLNIISTGDDPFIIYDFENINLDYLNKVDNTLKFLSKMLILVTSNILILLVLMVSKNIIALLSELYKNRKLISSLSKNDFKTKYAGSYLGIVWAFVQPIVTVLIYWFVFQVGFKSVPMDDFPFVLWLIAGMVPWFFFSEAIMNATNSMIEYSYLVKKVVFKISILPIVKVISALFVHLFFIAFTIFVYQLYGYSPSIYIVQVIYYTFCIFCLVLGISYATSAIVIFFRDLGQIVNILLQFGMWMTPIMWSYTMVSDKYQWILKLNPMYYIVEGYRDTFIRHVWFWERYNQTIYFWVITISLFMLGTMIFKKLKVHFADVL